MADTKETQTVETNDAPESQNGNGEPKKETQSQGFDLDKVVGPIADQINQRFDSMEKDFQEKIPQMVEQRISELRAPAVDPNELFGGTPDSPNKAPHGRRGEDPLTSRRYSYWKMFKVVNGVDGAEEEAKLEMAISRQLNDYYKKREFRVTDVKRSFLVPFGSSLLPDDIDEVSQRSDSDRIPVDQMAELLANPMVAQRMRDLAGQAIKDRTAGRVSKMTQALSIFDDTGLGIFTDPQITGELIELVRAQEVFARIGAREIALPPNGYLPLGAQTGAATGYWVGEAATITTSEPTTGKVELRAKKAAGLVIVPNELFRFSTRDTEAFLRMDLSRVLALLADLAGLEGVGGTNTPLGIINHDGVTTSTAGTTGANGDTFTVTDPGKMMAAVGELNHDFETRGAVWIMRKKMWMNILNRRADQGSGAETGAWQFAINREAINNGFPGQMNGYPVVTSGQVSNTRSKGSESDLTYILFGIPDDIVIGRIGVLEFTLGTEGTVNSINLFETDQAAIRAIEHVDFAMRHEDSWAFMDSLDMDLPSGVI